MDKLEGPLFKWTNMMKGYQQRHFVLDNFNGVLSYYTSREKLIKGERRGCILLKNARLGIEDEDDTIFTISVDGKIFHFKANTPEDRNNWIQSLEEGIRQNQFHPNRKQRPLRTIRAIKNASIEDFNHRLAETDCFLQILIEQFSQLDTRIENCDSEEERTQLQEVQRHSQNLLDSVKHAIVLLQIAKNIKYPINGVAVNETQNSSSSLALSEAECTNVEPIRQKLSDVKPLMKSVEVLDVPIVSYASSDDEDFFDATEESFDCDNPAAVAAASSAAISKSEVMNLKESLAAAADDGIDYDKFYEEDEDSDDTESMSGHGSVISHLISQVKIGMDLTKVALPTFILERRSLLEMYADFFAHADLFVSIPTYSSPQERMIQVVRWYLSAFHAGRKGSVAKKPYNPVLGEMFKCHWNLDKNPNASQLDQGAVPWARQGDLTFVAEQVSHHPPISAFYAESVDKRIMCSAHIWTKSKFLGLSVGVNNIGSGSIFLLDHGEEYTCTFPSAYGRSILTEPWFEMGGPVEVSCPQTGYHAKIEFLTKPFYGGKKHRIQAEIYGPPPTKSSIGSITGEWNGQMYIKWAKTGENELFFDTKSVPIIKKQVRSVREQEDYESRNYWKRVTVALKNQDVHEATAAKISIEQRQRELVKQRDENNQKWINRAFHNIGDKWQFNEALHLRQNGSTE